VALDGSEDNSMCREAADVWNELNVRQRINSAVAEAEAKHKDGTLRWTYGTVQSLITPFPRRGHLDVLQVGQEDEATPEPDGVPWDVAGSGGEVGEAGPEEEGVPEAEPEDCEEAVPYFDPADWESGVDVGQLAPQDSAALHKTMVMATPGAKDSQNHGDGDCGPDESLSAPQADALVSHSSRLKGLQQASGIVSALGGALGRNYMTGTVNRVIRDEANRFQVRARGDAQVEQEMRALLDAEEAKYRQGWRELQEHMQQVKGKRRVQRVERFRGQAQETAQGEPRGGSRGDGERADRGLFFRDVGQGEKEGRWCSASECSVS